MRRYGIDSSSLNGIISEVEHRDDGCNIYKLSPEMGTGILSSYTIDDAAEIIFSNFNLKKHFTRLLKHNAKAVEINYCLTGHVETEFTSNKIAYMSDGDISLYGYDTEIVDCDFTKRPYRGITIMLYMDKAAEWLGRLFPPNDKKAREFFETVLSADKTIISHATDSLDHIFKEFYAFPEEFKPQLMEIKTMEALLYLVGNFDYKASAKYYFSKTDIEKIKDAHSILTANLSRHVPIEELAEAVDLNSTYLKTGFKDVYGSPIYKYLKSYRLSRSTYALTQTDKKISEIALMFGYENPSKFSAAFKSQYGVTPLLYRRNRL